MRLKQRIKSLEEYLGVVYSDEDYEAHYLKEYGALVQLEKRLKALEDKAGINK